MKAVVYLSSVFCILPSLRVVVLPVIVPVPDHLPLHHLHPDHLLSYQDQQESEKFHVIPSKTKPCVPIQSVGKATKNSPAASGAAPLHTPRVANKI